MPNLSNAPKETKDSNVETAVKKIVVGEIGFCQGKSATRHILENSKGKKGGDMPTDSSCLKCLLNDIKDYNGHSC